MAKRFVSPVQINAGDAPSPNGDKAGFIRLLRDMDTALAGPNGLHVAEFAAERGILESEVRDNLELLAELGYRHDDVTRGDRRKLFYKFGQRPLFVASPFAAKATTRTDTGKRLCEECGKPFTSNFSVAVTCSAECSQLRASRQMREKYARRKQG